MKKLILFFDRLEDRIRHRLSRKPLLYAFIGGVGLVIFWRGVWHAADYFVARIHSSSQEMTTDLAGLPWWDGLLSIFVGATLLLMTGAFVSSFIGNEIIISGLKGEKRIAEKTEDEIEAEAEEIKKIEKDVQKISEHLSEAGKGMKK